MKKYFFLSIYIYVRLIQEIFYGIIYKGFLWNEKFTISVNLRFHVHCIGFLLHACNKGLHDCKIILYLEKWWHQKELVREFYMSCVLMGSILDITCTLTHSHGLTCITPIAFYEFCRYLGQVNRFWSRWSEFPEHRNDQVEFYFCIVWLSGMGSITNESN